MKQWGELKMYFHDCKNQQDEKNDSYKHVVYNVDYNNGVCLGVGGWGGVVTSSCPEDFY